MLDDQDKKWIDERLAERLAEQLAGAEARLESRLAEQLAGAEARLESRLAERLEHLETKLLTAFHSWASPMEARQRSHSAAIRALDLEVESIQDRLKKLEGQ